MATNNPTWLTGISDPTYMGNGVGMTNTPSQGLFGSSGSSLNNPYGLAAPYNVPNPTTGAQTLASGTSNSAPSGNSMQNAQTGWQNAFAMNQNIANNEYSNAAPLYNQTLQQQQAINYQPLQTASYQAGQEYGNLANTAGQQMNQYGQSAQAATNEQNNLYAGGNAIMNQAFDPNMAQYNQSLNNLQGQVNAGQAMRGLGNSAVGAQEYNNAASNFGIGWNTQQLQNEQIGLQSAAGAANAGANQGQLANQDRAGQLNAGNQQAGYTMQAASTPIQTQQTIASMPASNAAAYTANMGNLATGYNNTLAAAIPYLNHGTGAQQFASTQQANNTSSALGALGSLASFATNPNTASALSSAGSWLGNLTGASTAAPAVTSAADAYAAGSGLVDTSAAGSIGGALDLGGTAATAAASDIAGTAAADTAAASAGTDILGTLAAAVAWVICTELNKQGRLPNKYYVTGARRFAKYDDVIKQGYYIWAIPCVKHLRKNPTSLLSNMLEWVFTHRAEYIAAQYGIKSARKTIAGLFTLTGVHALCWTLSRTIARKPIDWTVLYKSEV